MRGLFGTITSHRLLVLKGLLFVALGGLAGGLLVAAAAAGVELGWWRVLALYAVGVWAFCRAYYFAFYVIEKYIDPGSRYAGLAAAARQAMRVLRGGSVTGARGRGGGG